MVGRSLLQVSFDVCESTLEGLIWLTRCQAASTPGASFECRYYYCIRTVNILGVPSKFTHSTYVIVLILKCVLVVFKLCQACHCVLYKTMWTHYTAIHTIQHYLLKTRTRRTCYFALDTSHKTCKRDSYNSKETCKRDVPTIHTQNITIYKKLAPGVLVASHLTCPIRRTNPSHIRSKDTFKRDLLRIGTQNTSWELFAHVGMH